MLSDRRIKREFKRLFVKEFKKEPEEEVYKFSEKFYKIEEIYKRLFDTAKHEVEVLNKYEYMFDGKCKPLRIKCTYLKDKGIYQYTINESGVMQESYEIYIGHYLRTHQL